MSEGIGDQELPGGITSLWRSMKLGYRAEPLLLTVAVTTTLAAAVPDALFPLALRGLLNEATTKDASGVRVISLAIGALVTLTWLLRVLSQRLTTRFGERAGVFIETHVARLQASIPGLDHQEQHVLLDRLAVLRNQVFALNRIYGSTFSTAGAALRLALTMALLASVHPVLLLLAASAVPPIAISSWRGKVERGVLEQQAVHDRLARHLFVTATDPGFSKEIRIAGIEQDLARRRQVARDAWYRPIARARWRSALWQTIGWGVFAASYVASLVYVTSVLRRPVGAVLLVLAAGSRVSQFLGQVVTEANFLRGDWLGAARRLAWLEDYADSQRQESSRPSPPRIRRGIRFENVSFRYPSNDRPALENINLELPAGAVVAVVGENGAGKSTLVKLLCQFYEPTAGRIMIDDIDLRTIAPTSWRSRVAGAFQDFFRFEYQAQTSIGLGDLPRRNEAQAVLTAAAMAGAEDILRRLPDGLRTRLGPGWPDGTDLSFGQWQKIALARGFMRRDTLLLVLDEPAASLDAESEHELFERYAEAAHSADRRAAGRITVLISHRFSTVQMADVIVVLDGTRVIEQGSHPDLMKAGGLYSELFMRQSAAYG